MSLNVVGITESQFFKMYSIIPKAYSCVKFLGKVSHTEALSAVAEADYSFLIRDENRVTKAGFPTKFVESISAGTAVIANDNSNVKQYISDGVGGYIIEPQRILEELTAILNSKIPIVQSNKFDFTEYIDCFRNFLQGI